MEVDEVDEGDKILVVRAERVGPLSRPHGCSAAPVIGVTGVASASAVVTGRGLRSKDLVGHCSDDTDLRWPCCEQQGTGVAIATQSLLKRYRAVV
jgi:hypothetical protein